LKFPDGGLWLRPGRFSKSVLRFREFALALMLLRFLGSAISRWRAGDAPVRGGTYFSLQRQRKVGKRKPLTPLMLV
jgi:hypothetical protein